MRLPLLIALTALLCACSPAVRSAPSSAEASESAAPAISVIAAPTSAVIESKTERCDAEINKAAADRLAERCRMVSPATHPPCNVANTCQMIQDEIDRSCAIWAKDTTQPKPAECSA